MAEEETQEKPTEEQTTEDNSTSPFAEADRINKEKSDLLDREEKILERKEKLAAREMVSGRAIAGQEPEKPKEETAKEYADKIMSGKKND